MERVTLRPSATIASAFVAEQFLDPEQTEYTIRDSQFPHAGRDWRPVSSAELEVLVKNGNTSDDWSNVLVTGQFDPHQILNSSFFGLVRIGAVEDAVLEHHDLTLPVGITNCRIIACDIGDHVALHNVHYLAHYIIGDRSILTNVDEMHVSDHAKFGNGVVKRGESEDVRVTLDLINETGSRAVAPFEGMTTADAYLWARYRDDLPLQKKLLQLTQERVDNRRGYYGVIGEQCVIKNTRIIKDVQVGSHCYIKGANKLKNLTINSDAEEITQIGEGVELVNGIIGYGCRIFYGCKAVRFIMGNNSNLKYGARLIHSFLGDNGTVSCCELLNNLIFPAHEQHHNNSFLVAALVAGQSNIAAGATIGSNHNSRSNDNEITAGRGFWPGLSTTLKHSSRFASFMLISKGDYPAELDIPLPFSLLSNNVAADRLELAPAFWWTRNMYALARNSWKFAARDTRIHRVQHIEFAALAPDTAEEILAARLMLEEWVGAILLGERVRWQAGPGSYAAIVRERGQQRAVQDCRAAGSTALRDNSSALDDMLMRVRGMEKSRRETVVLRAAEGWQAYGEMLHHYAATRLLDWAESCTPPQVMDYPWIARFFDRPPVREWVNLGGQLVPEAAVDDLRRDIGDGSIASWEAVHRRYDELQESYPEEVAVHAFGVYRQISEGSELLPEERWQHFWRDAVTIQELIRDRVFSSREKDYQNPFRIATYRSAAEMDAAIGSIEDNSFIVQVREETESYRMRISAFFDGTGATGAAR